MNTVKNITPTRTLLALALGGLALAATLTRPSQVKNPDQVKIAGSPARAGSMISDRQLGQGYFIDPMTGEVCSRTYVKIDREPNRELLRCYTKEGLAALLADPSFAAWYARAKK